MARATKKLLDNGLTQQQNKFKDNIVEQVKSGKKVNLTQAALNSYNTTDPHTAATIANDNMNIPDIREEIQKALKENNLTVSGILGNFGRLANHKPEKISADAVLRANQDLAKIFNLYPGQKHTQISLNLRANLNNKDFRQVKEELKVVDDELKAILGDEAPIEGEIVNE